MVIETHLIEDAETLLSENETLEEWNELVDKLGLKAQKDLAGKSPIPFPALSNADFAVYEALLDKEAGYIEFGSETIPLRVLSLIALAVEEQYFDEIYIRYADNVSDPVVYGIVGARWGRHTRFLIARWGKELLDLPSLRKMAAEKIHATYRATLEEKAAHIKAQLESIDSLVERKLQGETVWVG